MCTNEKWREYYTISYLKKKWNRIQYYYLCNEEMKEEKFVNVTNLLADNKNGSQSIYLLEEAKKWHGEK